ncbi:MAG: DUF4364 family protein [Oscillospiraceae bacterium]|nr:DUF4364 family protein [Oscillospiraceae bacterium]
MERFGFIHDKLEIKLLILFILARLEDKVDLDTLTDLTLCDAGITYFAVAECVSELKETDHLTEESGLIQITEKGRRNGRINEGSIPQSVRRKAEEKAIALAQTQRRRAMIKTEILPQPQIGFTVKLSLSDGLDQILALELYAATEAQAKTLADNFKKRAEQIHGKLIEALTEETP